MEEVLAPDGLITPECIQLVSGTATLRMVVKCLPRRHWNAVREVEAHPLRTVLEDAKGNKAEAARILEIQRRLVYEKMAEFGLS